MPAQWEERSHSAGLISWHGFPGLLGDPAQRWCHALLWFCRRPGYGFRIKLMNLNMKSTPKLTPSQLEQLQLLTSQPVSPWRICGVLWFRFFFRFLLLDWNNRFSYSESRVCLLGLRTLQAFSPPFPGERARRIPFCPFCASSVKSTYSTLLVVRQAPGLPTLGALSLKMVLDT